MTPSGHGTTYAKFCRSMANCGRFEKFPIVAVAVSGGSDSMALTLLANEWAKSFGGRVIALTVDHGLRKDSKLEIKLVEKWMDALKIKHCKLKWDRGGKTSAIQQEARVARYNLMEKWCSKYSVLHLLLGHTKGDQAETFMMRRAKGSLVNGLAGMSVIVDRIHCQFLRPLLSFSRSELRVFLKSQLQPWIDDPSNHDLQFERVRWRQIITQKIVSEKRILDECYNFGQKRLQLKRETSKAIALLVSLKPQGFCNLDKLGFNSLRVDLKFQVLAKILITIGGLCYAPSTIKIENMIIAMGLGFKKSKTLGRCLIYDSNDRYFFFREQRNLPDPLKVNSGQSVFWDGRFLLKFSYIGDSGILRPLARKDSLIIIKQIKSSKIDRMSLSYLPTLPALYTSEGLYSIPELGFSNALWDSGNAESKIDFLAAIFRPKNSLSGPGFKLINGKNELNNNDIEVPVKLF